MKLKTLMFLFIMNKNLNERELKNKLRYHPQNAHFTYRFILRENQINILTYKCVIKKPLNFSKNQTTALTKK